MLDKYEFDTRIDRICGTNLLGKYDIPYDYFFTNSGNSWGWATWKRVADSWDSGFEYMDEPYAVQGMRNLTTNLEAHLKWEQACLTHEQHVSFS